MSARRAAVPPAARSRYTTGTNSEGRAVTTLILDDDLKAKLEGLTRRVEVRDETGKTVGWFVPEEEERLRRQYAEAKEAFAREEAEEAARGIVRQWDGTNGKTTAEAIAEVLKRAEQLAKSGKGPTEAPHGS